MRFVWILGLSLCWLEGACRFHAPEATYHVVGYVYGPRIDSLETLQVEGLTHLNYAFANVRPDGRVVLESPADSQRLRRVLAARGIAGPKVLLSIGGWSWSDYFSEAALTEGTRRRFAESAAALLETFDLDGLDIDWEYPGQAGEGNVYRAEDRENFTLLLATVRAQLAALAQVRGRPYLLTIAAGVDSTYLAHIELEQIHPLLDFINLMTYDFHGSWTPHTGHHANLYPTDLDTEQLAVDVVVQRYLQAGVPAKKLVIGVPFYGRGWQGVWPAQQGRYQPYEAVLEENLSFARLQAEYIDQGGFVRYWDAEAHAPYLWNAARRIFISYEDAQSLQVKVAYVQRRCLGGVMFWEYSADPSGALRKVLIAINRPFQ